MWSDPTSESEDLIRLRALLGLNPASPDARSADALPGVCAC